MGTAIFWERQRFKDPKKFDPKNKSNKKIK